MFLPQYVIKILDELKINGYEGYAVGGCVRDSLSGKIPDDYDITVPCLPEKTAEIFGNYKVIETGLKHGTVTVLSEGHPIEITTFRNDGEYKDNRHPEKVTFTGKVEDDLARRDFTVNAMAYSRDSGLIDLFSGKKDLENGIIRCVGEPQKRFEEDALRIMRAVRFSSVLGFDIDEKTFEAAEEKKELLKNISAERIYTELKKLLCGKNARAVLKKSRKILSGALPSLEELTDEEYELTSERIMLTDSLPIKITLLLCCLGEEKADNALKELKSDNKQRKTTAFLIANMEKEFSSVGEVLRFAGENGIERLKELADFRRCTGITDDNLLKEGMKKAEKGNICLKISDLAVNGKDLEEAGYKGKKIGEKLSELLKAVTDGQTENTKEALMGNCKT